MRVRAFCIALLILAPAPVVFAQTVEITPFFGFAATDVAEEDASRHHHDRSDYDHSGHHRDHDAIEVDDETISGLSLGFGLTRHTQIELLYSQQGTTYRNTAVGTSFDLDLDYAHVGVVYQWTLDRLEPFVVGSIGTTRIDSGIARADDVFSVSGGGGLKVMFNERVGLRLTGRVFVSSIEESDPLLCPVGTCGDSGEEALAQLDLSAGLVLRFGNPTRPHRPRRSSAPRT